MMGTAVVKPVSPEVLDEAATLLQTGRLVAFPTETVYGLGANALIDTAVAGIFAAKGRPHFNPLIVHVPDMPAALELAEFDGRARDIAARFWPGPLTMVLPRRPDSGLSHLVSAGLPTVALRMPAHPLAQDLLRRAGCPVAAPSANRSGSISPTQADHVAGSLGDRVDLIIDGGACAVGLESTVIDLSGPQAALLRPGGVAREDLEAVLGPLVLSTEADDAPKSPGQLLSHYAPSCPVRLQAESAGEGEALLGFQGTPGATLDLSPTGNLLEAAANLFAMMHRLDAQGWRGIAVAPIPEEGLGLAINDRLRRAAAPRDSA